MLGISGASPFCVARNIPLRTSFRPLRTAGSSLFSNCHVAKRTHTPASPCLSPSDWISDLMIRCLPRGAGRSGTLSPARERS